MNPRNVAVEAKVKIVTRSLLLRYGLAAVSVALVGEMKILLEPLLGRDSPFLLFFAAVMISAWYGGLWPGLLAAILSALITDFFFLPPYLAFSLGTESAQTHLQLAMFLVEAVLISWLTESLHASRRQADDLNRAKDDVLDRERLAHAAVGAAEQRYRDLVNGLDAIVWEAEPETLRFTFVSQRAEAILGYPVERWLTQPDFWVQLIHPDDRERILQQRVNADGRDHDLEYQALAADGRIVWLRDLAYIVPDDSGRVRHLRGLMIDITERKRAEETSALLATIVESSQDAIIGQSLDGTIVSWNEGAQRIFGYTAGEVIGRPFLVLAPPHRTDEMPRILGAVMLGERIKHFETERRRKDGKHIHVSISVSPIKNPAGRIIGVSNIARDITERKQAEEALRKWEQIFTHAGWAVAIINPADNRFQAVNPAFARMHGYTVEELVGKPLADTLAPECRDASAEHGHLADEKGDHIYESIHLHKDGPYVPVLTHVSAFKDRGGSVLYRAATFQDLTERKIAVRRLNIRHVVTLKLAEAGTVQEAARGLLQALCEGLDWKLGIFWSIDRNTQVLRLVDVWHMPAVSAPEFEKLSRQMTFPPGTGLPGRVWASGEPAWIVDVAKDPNFPRAAVATAEGLHAAFGFPIVLGNEVLGVVEFFSSAILEPDRDLLNMLAVLGSQIGQFLERKRIEEAVRESEARKSAILASALDAIITMDGAGKVLEFNPAAEQTFGYTRDEAVGQDLAELMVPPRLRAAHRQGLVHYLDAGEGVLLGRRVEMPAVRKDGSEFAIELSITPITTARGPIFTAFLRDITYRKEVEKALRQSEARFRQLADAMPQIVWAARPDGYLDYYNRRWYEFTGFPEGQEGVESWRPILHPDDIQPWFDRWYGAVRSGEPYEIEHRFRDHQTGDYRWFLGRALPVRDEAGHIVRWYGTCTDIDDQKRAQEALQEADRRKDEFLAMLAHELRNPLAPIRNALHIMGMHQLDDPELADARAVVERQVQQLAGMVDDLLDVFQITLHKITLRKELLDLAQLIKLTVEDYRRALEDTGRTVTLEAPAEPVWVLGDSTRLAQVLSNLLLNASKFTNPGDEVAVRVAPDDKGQRAIVMVRDTGVGIAPDVLPHVFEIFTQANQGLARGQGGLGIGLSLVKGLVELHGGNVQASSGGPGCGTELSFWLPLSKKAPVPTKALPPPAVPAQQLRILIVEDNQDTAKTLRVLLKRYGHEVTLAHAGTTGVETAKRWHPDVVLCDLGLPEMDGYGVARTLRNDPDTASTRLIAVSGYGQEEDRKRSEEAGFDLHLTKPVDPAELQRLLAVLKVGR
jgi:PAS domain S-box-containing protein